MSRGIVGLELGQVGDNRAQSGWIGGQSGCCRGVVGACRDGVGVLSGRVGYSRGPVETVSVFDPEKFSKLITPLKFCPRRTPTHPDNAVGDSWRASGSIVRSREESSYCPVLCDCSLRDRNTDCGSLENKMYPI